MSKKRGGNRKRTSPDTQDTILSDQKKKRSRKQRDQSIPNFVKMEILDNREASSTQQIKEEEIEKEPFKNQKQDTDKIYTPLDIKTEETEEKEQKEEEEEEEPVKRPEDDDKEELTFEVLTNDGKLQTLEYLLQLKNIFSGELPRMPKNYIARLVFDRHHQALMMFKQPRRDLPEHERPKTKKRVIGGITFRPVNAERFIEIAFCAVTSLEQRRGYGRVLMNNLKSYCQQCRWMRFLTYADNFAVTYFEKLGFSKTITMDESRYLGYIKDYTEATVMECMLHPRIDYLHIPVMIEKQREAVFDRMKEVDSSHSIFDAHETRQRILGKILNQMKNSEDSWPFLKPVTLEEAPDYYDVIKNPMDLQTMEEKLKADRYQTIDQFVDDMMLIFKNCRSFNRKSSVYYHCANECEKQFKLFMNRLR